MTALLLWPTLMLGWLVFLFVIVGRLEGRATRSGAAAARTRTASLRLVSVTPTAIGLLVDGLLERGDPLTLALDSTGMPASDVAELTSWSDDNAVVDLTVDPNTWTAHLLRGDDDLHVPMVGLSS